ncbi:nuclear pore complex protein Nup155-like [Pollicipes pollicipes]|uniref:nuclear pore complex protein Nup155-like n=1 Tax=Pollicipes pollicipes TaxID=41117 RepID=UPI0018851261|nr:nuclear pore complex protein Nup155-like [Pollicipes pollicipes]
MPASPAVGLSFSLRPMMSAGGGPPEALESAGRTLDRLLQADSQFPSLAERLRIAQQACPTVSGQQEADYPSLGGLRLKQLAVQKKVPLPAELVEHFNHLQCNCMMGLFPELNRAWLTIDNDIYVWLFESGGDLTYYDGMSETILSVAMVRPRPGVFQSHIQHLLCLATPLEIVLLGVTLGRPRDPAGPAEMHVLPEPLFAIASDGAYVTTIVGTPAGRVFLGAKDGCLYELVYQATDSWFSRRCRKINHSSSALSVLVPTFLAAAFSDEDPLIQLVVDESRNVLYTRSEKSTVQVYDLGADGQQTVRVAALSQFSIAQAAAGIASSVDASNFRPIIDVSPVTAAESRLVHLVVTTQTGVRLYFSTGGAGSRPRPAGLHMARYAAGAGLLLAAQSDDLDVLWLLSGDAFPVSPRLTELQSTLPLDGHTWALQPLPERQLMRLLGGFHPQQMSTPQPGRGPPSQLPQLSLSADASLAAPVELFSGKHDGLYLYVSRLLRPLWASRVVREFSPRPGQLHLLSAATSEELDWLCGQLQRLSRFMEQHKLIFSPPYVDTVSTQQLQQRMNSFLPQEGSGGGGAARPQLGRGQQAQAAERQSLICLAELVDYTRQVLGLLKIITDHQTTAVTEALSKEDQSALRLMTLRDLALSGRAMCTQLVNALIGRYLNDNASTEAVSAELRRLAPAVYREEDELSSRASEMLVSARDASSAAERERLVREALRLAKQVAGQLNLPVVCQHFQSVHDYEGVVELVLAAAEKRDVQDAALHYYRAGEPPDDVQGGQAFKARFECYNEVMKMLSSLKALAESGQRQSPVPARPGPPPLAAPADQPQEARRRAELVIEAVLASSDELLHVALYNWMMTSGMSDRLLQVKSRYIEPFLTRVSGAPTSVDTLDLLWKYYEMNSQHLATAKVLAKLAERDGSDVSLEQRIEYLARAILCVKSSQMQVSAAASQGEFLHELEEKMEVARVQRMVLEAVRGRAAESKALNAGLLDVTALYEMCSQLGLHRGQLAVVVCAGHRDPALVRALWTGLLRAELKAAGAAEAEAAAPAVVELARTYSGQPAYFPLETIVHELEVHSCRYWRDPSPGWAAAALAQAGVPLPQLLAVYQSLYRQKDDAWRESPLHLLHAICRIVAGFSRWPSGVPARERRAFATTCLDLMAAYVNDLNASPALDARELADQLKTHQAELERLLRS